MTRRSLVIFVVGMAGTALVVAIIFAVFTSATKSSEIRQTQESRASQVASNDETLAIIRGCTTPGEKCYERGQRQLAKAVGDINRVVVLAAACASGPDARSEAAIQRCIIARLADENP